MNLAVAASVHSLQSVKSIDDKMCIKLHRKLLVLNAGHDYWV